MSPNLVRWTLIVVVAGGMLGLVLYADEQGWGGGLTVGVGVGAVLVVAIGYAIYEAARKRRRRKVAPQAAAALGLIPAPDATPMAGLPFELMSRGGGRTAENVMTGDVDGTVWVFDYTYYTTSYDTRTNTTSRNDFNFSCAVGELRAAGLAPIRISREGFFSKVARAVGVEDVEIGVEPFDRRFKVKAQDPALAREVLHPGLQQWLMDLGDEVNFELADGLALAYTKQRDLMKLRPLLDAVVGFRQSLPETVLERHTGTA